MQCLLCSVSRVECVLLTISHKIVWMHLVSSLQVWVLQTAVCALLIMSDKNWLSLFLVKITFELLPNNWFIFTRTNSMKCFVNWIPANLHVRSNKTQPNLKSKTRDNRKSWRFGLRISGVQLVSDCLRLDKIQTILYTFWFGHLAVVNQRISNIVEDTLLLPWPWASVSSIQSCVCVLLCFIQPILGDCYAGPGVQVSLRSSQGVRTHDDWESPTCVLTLFFPSTS